MSESRDERTDDAITVYADYVCPFCYLGRKSLEQYQAEREQPLAIDWQPFDLRAGKRTPEGEIDDSVDDGTDEEYFEQARQNVRRLQDEYGVEMTEELRTDVDSLDAQVASSHVAREHDYDDWLAFDLGLYDALWQDGRDVGDPDVIADVAADVGLDPDEVRDAIEDEALGAELEERFDAARERGVTGVPTFVYGERAARGAVPPDQLRRLVEDA